MVNTVGRHCIGPEMLGLESDNPSNRRMAAPNPPSIWVGSESANALDCKSSSFGNSGLDTHPAHQYADVVELADTLV